MYSIYVLTSLVYSLVRLYTTQPPILLYIYDYYIVLSYLTFSIYTCLLCSQFICLL